MELESYKITALPHGMSKEEISELLECNEIKNIIEEGIKGSMIPKDPNGILEQLWDEF
jgi:hypothetical protein